MSSLLLEKDLRTSEQESEVRTLARARTLTVLERLDPSRKTAVYQFLVDSDLVQSIDERDPIISLNGADLGGANVSDANLRNADLNGADLNGADLSEADLYKADLSGANLRFASLILADLRWANLSEANLRNANLHDAVGLTDERIAAAVTLQGATMPNGQNYTDWLISNGTGEK
jgi:uncharacterized protein YjbI with pentapeptide repeats